MHQPTTNGRVIEQIHQVVLHGQRIGDFAWHAIPEDLPQILVSTQQGFVALTRSSKIRRPQRMTSMMEKTKTPRKTLPAGIGKILKRLHYPLDVILLCVRWYVAYSLSLRNREEMMAERGIDVDHSSVHRWVIKLLPVFEKAFRKRKRPVGKSWRVDETYVKVKGQ